MITPAPTLDVHKRQLWALPTPTTTSSTSGLCKTFTLPSGGSLVVNNSSTIAFSSNVVYQPPCSGSPAFLNSADNGTQPIDGYRDPFYASVTPLVYIVALTTAMAWMLMLVLIMFPASYHGYNTRVLTQPWRRGDGIFSLLMSRSSPFPLGNRPWLQRFAGLMVVIALTTVTADTFRHAQDQYDNGYSDATKLRNLVSGSLEVRVIRVISDLFLWLAQIQTLIRLFPRRKEKLVIKWVGFVLILLDIIFSCLNSFYIDNNGIDSRPRSYRDAIPALSYLFQFALNLLYAAWVLYFVMTKRRYAFYHHMMPEICIVAAISLLSLIVPVVFFLVDILEPDVSAWGDYFRWIGSAAASIVVWEWVERIDFVEREEKKDGILGREIFEEDDFDAESTPRGSSRQSLDVTEKETGLGRRYRSAKTRYDDKVSGVMRRFNNRGESPGKPGAKDVDRGKHAARNPAGRRKTDGYAKDTDQLNIRVPPPVASPVDRGDTDSPGSTIYAIHYHPTTQTPPMPSQTPLRQQTNNSDDSEDSLSKSKLEASHKGPVSQRLANHTHLNSWRWPVNAFRKSRQSPPVEVKNALSQRGEQRPESGHGASSGIFSGLLGGISLRRDDNTSHARGIPQQPTVIPPPTRGTQPWTPDSIRRATQNQTPITTSSPAPQLSTVHETSCDARQSDTHDFASPSPGREDTPYGNLSGTTALNNSSDGGPASSSEGVSDANERHSGSTEGQT